MQTFIANPLFPEAPSAPAAPRAKQMSGGVARQTGNAQTLAKRRMR
jgi:hypothetical protein